MKLERYALIAEIVGAVAVVVSMLYVAYSIQINTAERRAASVESITSGYRQLALVYVNNEAAGIAWHKVLDREELTERQLDLMSDSIYAHLMALEEAYNKYQEGYIDEEFLNARVSLMRTKLLASPQIRAVYEGMTNRQGGSIYTKSFVEWLNKELQKSPWYNDPPPITKLEDSE